MKRVYALIGIFFFSLALVWANDNSSTSDNDAKMKQVINISPDIMKKYPIKTHHQKLSFGCIHCHQGQGTAPEKLEAIGDEGCLSCHGSKLKIAARTGYMDLFHTNPHNSYHDGPTLSCDECHKEHEPSQNRCLECHTKEVPNWMRKVTP